MGGSTAVVAGLVGVSSLLYLAWQLIGRLRKHNVRGKVVLITGASSGLGEECANIFYKAGAKLILCARREEELQRVKGNLMKLSAANETYEPQVLTLDISNLDVIPSKVRTALSFFGQVDILINNAGQSYRGLGSDTEIDVHVRLMTVNYFGQIAVTREIVRDMMGRNRGHIVNVSSVQGRISIPFRTAYGASKHALQAYADGLRAELSNTKINVCSICPGYIRTNLSLNAVSGDGSSYGAMDKTIAQGMDASYVAKRILRAVEYAEPEVVIAPLSNKLAILIRTLFPSLYFKIMAQRAASQRAGEELVESS